MSFSAGGTSQPLVRLSSAGRELTLRWPGRLPRPELAGDTATYRDVLPGVDLRLQAMPQGYNTVFVVKDRAAAAQPALRRLAFGLRTSGVSVRMRPDRSLVGLDAAGEAVFQAPPPALWDSGRARALGGLELDRGPAGGAARPRVAGRPRHPLPGVRRPQFLGGQVGMDQGVQRQLDHQLLERRRRRLAREGRLLRLDRLQRHRQDPVLLPVQRLGAARHRRAYRRVQRL
ncbi:MAG: hypothetical protein ACRDT6_10700 [Micromonosporaceae bacterium]